MNNRYKKTLTLQAGDIIYLALDTERANQTATMQLTGISSALSEYHVQKALDDMIKAPGGYSEEQRQ